MPDYLVSILVNPPHNLTVKMANHLSKNPEVLAFYTDVIEAAKSITGVTVYKWYTVYVILLIQARSSIVATIAPFQYKD